MALILFGRAFHFLVALQKKLEGKQEILRDVNCNYLRECYAYVWPVQEQISSQDTLVPFM